MGTILVTGDSRGVGNSIVKQLLTSGYKVIGLSRNSSKEIELL